ncbi:MAG: DUF1667 domain-containing protein [Treponema sp.]|nr:DUF1667 domain-containing protein [Treponema sp.]
MLNITCIVCPIGCSLEVDNKNDLENISVTGNGCQRGLDYALEEIRAPKRVVTATVQIDERQFDKKGTAVSIRRVPVKTVTPCLREKIPLLLKDIYKVQVKLPVKTGDIIISNWNGEGIDVAVTRTVG